MAGEGTPEQQQLFQDTADILAAAYDTRFPDAPEDRDGMIADQLAGAAQYALGDASLEGLRVEREAAEQAVRMARDVLRGACVAAVQAGHPKIQVAGEAGVTRRTLDKWVGER